MVTIYTSNNRSMTDLLFGSKDPHKAPKPHYGLPYAEMRVAYHRAEYPTSENLVEQNLPLTELVYEQFYKWHTQEIAAILERIEKANDTNQDYANEGHVGSVASPANMSVRELIAAERERLEKEGK